MDIKTTLENVILSLALPEKKEKKPKKMGGKIKYDSLETFLEEEEYNSKSNEEKIKILESYIKQRSEDAGTKKEINYVKLLLKGIKPKGKRGRPKKTPITDRKNEEKERKQMGQEDINAPEREKHPLELLAEEEKLSVPTRDNMINFIIMIDEGKFFPKRDKGNHEERKLFENMKKEQILPTTKTNKVSLVGLRKLSTLQLYDIIDELIKSERDFFPFVLEAEPRKKKTKVDPNKPKAKRGRPKGSGKVVPKGSVKPSVRPKKEKPKPKPIADRKQEEKEREQMGKEDVDAPKKKRGRPKKPEPKSTLIADRKREEKEREQMGEEDMNVPKKKRGLPPKKSKPIKDRKREEKEREQMGQEDFILPVPEEKVEEDQSRVFDENFDVEDYIIEPLPIISKKIELAKINDKFKGIDNQLDKEKKQKLKEIRDKLTEEVQQIRERMKPLKKGKTEKQLESLLNKEDRQIAPFKNESDKAIKEIKKQYDKLIEDNKNQYNKELEAFDKRDLDEEVVDLMIDIFKDKIVNDKTISIMDDDIFNIEIDGNNLLDSMTYDIFDIMDYLVGKYNELKGTDYKSRRIFDEDKGEELIKFFKKKRKKGGKMTASIRRGGLLVKSDKIREGGEMTASISRGRGLVRSDRIRGGKYPHKMYKDGDIQIAETEEDHNRLEEEGYTHRKGGVLRSDKIGTIKEQMVRGKTKRTQTRKRQIARDDVGPVKKRGRPRAIAKDTIAPPYISKLDIEIKPIDIRKIKMIDELAKRKENILRFADDPANFYDVPTRFL